MIRAFVAITIDPRVIKNIAAAIDRLRPKVTGPRWIALENIHVTLKFLGAIEDTAVEPIVAALTACLRPFQPFTINATGLGVFPGPRRPRVLWIGLAGDHLLPLASAIESALVPLGFAPENRQFTPHLTIGRWRDNTPAPPALATELEKWKDRAFGQSEVANVLLMQSLLRPGGAQYHPIVTVPLSAGQDPSNARGTGGD